MPSYFLCERLSGHTGKDATSKYISIFLEDSINFQLFCCPFFLSVLELLLLQWIPLSFIWYVPSTLSDISHQIPNFECLLSRLAVVFVQPIAAMYWVENKDVVGAAPTGDAQTTSECGTIFLTNRVRLILDVLRQYMRTVCVTKLTHIPLGDAVMILNMRFSREHLDDKSALAQVIAWWYQAITWAYVDPDPSHDMTSPCHRLLHFAIPVN